MSDVSKIINEIKTVIDRVDREISDGESLEDDRILGQFYKGRLSVLKKEKDDLKRILNMLRDYKIANTETKTVLGVSIPEVSPAPIYENYALGYIPETTSIKSSKKKKAV